MSDKITNTQDRAEEKPLTEQEMQFCNLYVNGGLEYGISVSSTVLETATFMCGLQKKNNDTKADTDLHCVSLLF